MFFGKKTIINVIASFVICFNYAFADVVQLAGQALVAGAPAAHGNAPAANTFGDFVLQNQAIPANANALFVIGINWQMIGYSAFFQANNQGHQVYAAKKRVFVAGTALANNDPGHGGDLLNYTTNMHTERQLVIAALEGQLAQQPGIAGAGNAIIQGGLLIPANPPAGALATLNALAGDLHIYTAANPCQNSSNDNGHYSCIQYYNDLAANAIPNINVHVYYIRNDMRLNKNFISTNQDARNALCNFIAQNQILNNLKQIQDQQGHNVIQYSQDGGVNWTTLARQNVQQWNIQGQLVGKINTLISTNSFNAQQLDQMFNVVHNTLQIQNLFYHGI